MNKIKTVSYILRFIFLAAFFLLPIYTAVYWLTNGYPFGSNLLINVFPSAGPNLPYISDLNAHMKMIGLLINFIPVTIYMWMLYCLIRLFKLYGAGTVFTVQNVKYIRWIGIILLVAEIVKPLYTFLMSFTLTYSNPPGYRYAYINFNLQDVATVVIAMLIILISWIMDEGYKIHEEQAYTV